MVNWVIRCSEEWLKPVYDRIHEKLMECQVLLMDETRIQCNKEEGKKAPFATAKRIWLFADTSKGAKANAVLYTLVESARLNELDVYTYLKYLLAEMPNNHHLEHPKIIDNYLP